MSDLLKVGRRFFWPVVAFGVVLLVHYIMLGLFPEHDVVQDRWASIELDEGWLGRYLAGQNYWLGLTLAMPVAFSVSAFQRYRENQRCEDRTLTIGGLTLAGVASTAGCFLVGCCGSPMLGVYLSLLGPAFLPFAKPLAAALTALILAWTWWGMRRRARRLQSAPCEMTSDACGCQLQDGNRLG